MRDKNIFHKCILFALIAAFHLSAFSQPISKQRRERMKMVRHISKTKAPCIRLNDSRELSVDEFLSLTDSIQWIRTYKYGSEEALKWGDVGVHGVIDVRTVQYRDSLEMTYRKNSIRSYRQNELISFFGKEEPLILFGDHKISREEFCELPEDTVAFINFYLTDFVKKRYAPEGEKGIVFVCPRKTRSPIKYTNFLPKPANGRNYMDDFGYSSTNFTAMGDSVSYSKYIQEKLKNYENEIAGDIQATVVVSCFINTDGVIKPILVERIETGAGKELSNEQQNTLIAISEEIICSMPRWEPGFSSLFDIDHNQYITDIREVSRPIYVHFGTDNLAKVKER